MILWDIKGVKKNDACFKLVKNLTFVAVLFSLVQVSELEGCSIEECSFRGWHLHGLMFLTASDGQGLAAIQKVIVLRNEKRQGKRVPSSSLVA